MLQAMCAVSARESARISLKPVININSAEQAFLAPRLLLTDAARVKFALVRTVYFAPWQILQG